MLGTDDSLCAHACDDALDPRVARSELDTSNGGVWNGSRNRSSLPGQACRDTRLHDDPARFAHNPPTAMKAPATSLRKRPPRSPSPLRFFPSKAPKAWLSPLPIGLLPDRANQFPGEAAPGAIQRLLWRTVRNGPALKLWFAYVLNRVAGTRCYAETSSHYCILG
jgi:hypothetical protein